MPEKKLKIKKVAKTVGTSPIIIVKASGSQMKSFLDFIRTQGVVGLAVGLVLGGAVTVLVKSIVDNMVMPPIGLLLGSAEGLKGLVWTIGKTTAGLPVDLHYGILLNDFINFAVIALVVYVIVKLFKFEQFDIKKSK